jgi:two-component system cell cycle response regulator PopA
VAEEEFELRVATFAEHGRRLEAPNLDKGPLRVLAVGEPAPQFLSLSNALVEAGADVVGAFTAYTAFDYLHDRRFEAVVLWAGDDRKEALQIATGMRRNTRLFHIPALLYLQQGGCLSPAEAFEKGISDVASPGTPEGETARRVAELARAYRRQTAVRAALEKARGSGLMDAATGLFTRDLFASHLVRLAHAAWARNRTLSVCVLKVADTAAVGAARAGGYLDRAVPQIGSMIGRLVRVEDTGARLGAEVFALAMPDTTLPAAMAACERIAAVIACTAFDAGANRPPFVAEFDIGAAQVEVGQNAARALEIAAAQARRREAG